MRLYVDGVPYGQAYGDVGIPSAWHHLGTVPVPQRRVDFALAPLSKPAWQSGSQRSDLTGRLVLEPPAGPRIKRVPAHRASALCGRRLDWVELPAG